MISIVGVYIDGTKNVWKEKKLLFLIYLVQFVFAYLMTLPVTSLLEKAISGSTSGERILQQFDFTIFSTILREYGKGIDIKSFLIIYGLIYFIISTFFMGGIIWLFVSQSKFSINEFFSNCNQYFYRFIRLFFVSLLFNILVVLVSMLFVNILIQLFAESMNEMVKMKTYISGFVVVIILLALVNMIFDYAKIITVSENKHQMFFVPMESTKFIFMNFIKTSGLYGLYFFSIIILISIYLLVESLFDVQSFLGVITFFVLTQIYIFLRQWVRLSFFSGQTLYYQHTIKAQPGMLTKDMLDMEVDNNEKRTAKDESPENE